jgi:hypothetical protein
MADDMTRAERIIERGIPLVSAIVSAALLIAEKLERDPEKARTRQAARLERRQAREDARAKRKATR